ncbi:MAG: glycosyltransferase 87 family protein [Candidatus Eisenbacteria bacterium]
MPSSPGRSTTAASVALIVGIVIHAVFLLSLSRTHWLDPVFLEAQTAYGQAGDYFGIHQAGRNLLDGYSIYDCQNYRQEATPVVPYLYFYRYLPPTAYVAALGAAVFSPWQGYWFWIVVNELLLLGLLASLWRWPGITRTTRNALIGITLGFFPFYLEQWMGQYSLLMACCLWLVFASEIRRSDAEAAGSDESPAADDGWRSVVTNRGFWAWVATLSVKSYTALFAIVYVLRGRWRTVLLAGVIVLALIIPYYLSRPEDLVEFLRLNLKPMPPKLGPVRYGLVAVTQFLGQRFIPPDALAIDVGVKTITASEVPVYAWIAFVGLVTAAITLRSFRHARAERLLVLWLLAFFAIYKDIWEYHHVMLLPALFTFILTVRSRVPWILLVWLALPSANILAVDFWKSVPMSEWSLAQVAVHHAFYALPVGIFYVWVAKRCLERTTAQPNPSRGQEVTAERRKGRHGVVLACRTSRSHSVALP